MKKYKENFSHTLVAPVEYATGGATAKAARLFVKAPANAQLTELSMLEEANNAALFNVAVRMKDAVKGEAKPPVPQAEITDEEAEQHVFLLSSNGFKLAAGFAGLKGILTNPRNPALMDGKEPITDMLFEQLAPVDTRILLGKYLLNFLNFSQPA